MREKTGRPLPREGLSAQVRQQVQLTFQWPWWLHPAWTLALFTGTLAIFSVWLDPSQYGEWETAKWLTGQAAFLLLFAIFLMAIAMLIGGARSSRGGDARTDVSPAHLKLLTRAYVWCLRLALLGYALWIATGLRNGVGTEQLIAVLDRRPGAVSGLKRLVPPIGGLTTLTQLAAPAVALGVLLRRAEQPVKGLWLLGGLAIARAIFYAERLAILEIVVPLCVTLAITSRSKTLDTKLWRWAPAIAMPAGWTIFAISEYTRSWIYYSQYTSLPFWNWVTLRLVGYYSTSFNNSALIYTNRDHLPTVPFYSIRAFWEAPLVSSLVPQPETTAGYSIPQWFGRLLVNSANINFTNEGSVLVVLAEAGPIAGLAALIGIAFALGQTFRRMSQGSVPALLLYATAFVGLLELPRFTYWTQGRFVPVAIFCLILSRAWTSTNSASNEGTSR